MSTTVLRRVVFILAVLAAVKLVFFHSGERTEKSIRMSVTDPLPFWKVKQKFIDPTEEKRRPSSLPSQDETVRAVTNEPVLLNVSPMKIVHLDLKGAAPKIKYLEQIFPLLSFLGANGILMEYEDMFPYNGDLQILRSPYAYSMEDIGQIKIMARRNNLDIIPLVQVFGHLEFVLKHENFYHLREVSQFSSSLNFLHPNSTALVKSMVTQVMALHPEATWFHMGGDEVNGLGTSQASKNNLESNNGELFLKHTVEIAHFISENRMGLRVMMWDDMIRQISPTTIQKSGLQDLVIPTIWQYLSAFDIHSVENLISRYQTAGFKGVWFASAFKGASDISQMWTPLNYHLQNHLSWLKIITSMSTKYPSIFLQGILLTGRQRYQHHTVLCELFPVGIPSLAMCLQTLKHGSFGENAQSEAYHILGCKIKWEKNLCEGSGSFPGSQIYRRVHTIHTQLRTDVDSLLTTSIFRGGFSSYHRKHNFAHPRLIGMFQGQLKTLLHKWETYIIDFRVEMEGIFFTDAVEEWMEDNINTQMNKLQEYAQEVERILKLNGLSKSLQT